MSVQRGLLFAFLLIITGLMASRPDSAHAESVRETFEGRILNANFEQISESGRFVLIVPSTDGNHQMELIQTLQALLKENDVNSLAFTSSLLISDRKDMYYCDRLIQHTSNDNLAEIDFWLNWLRKKGAKSIPILGHSRSTVTLTIFAGRRLPEDVPGMVFLAPATRPYGDAGVSRYETRYKVKLSDILARADKMIAAGKAEVPMKEIDYGLCPAATVTPKAFVDHYRHELLTDFLSIWQDTTKPILIIGGSADTLAPDIDQVAKPAMENSKVRIHVVEDAGHFFRDLFADEVVEVVAEFIESLD